MAEGSVSPSPAIPGGGGRGDGGPPASVAGQDGAIRATVKGRAAVRPSERYRVSAPMCLGQSYAEAMTLPQEVEPPDPFSQFVVRLVPKVGVPLAQFREDRFQSRLKRAQQMAAQLGSETDLEPSEILRRVYADERMTEVFETAIESGIATAYEDKRRLLARALAQGLHDDADIDETLLLVKAITGLEVLHVRVLDRMVSAELSGQEPHPDQVIEELYPGRSELVGPLVATLVQLGLVASGSGFGALKQEVTGFGYRVIEVVRSQTIERPHRPIRQVDTSASDFADLSAVVEQRVDIHGQSLDEVLVILNRGPSSALQVNLTFGGLDDQSPFIGEPFPAPEIEANTDYQVPLVWSMGDPTAPYAAELTWTDGRGNRVKPLKLMPRVIG